MSPYSFYYTNPLALWTSESFLEVLRRTGEQKLLNYFEANPEMLDGFLAIKNAKIELANEEESLAAFDEEIEEFEVVQTPAEFLEANGATIRSSILSILSDQVMEQPSVSGQAPEKVEWKISVKDRPPGFLLKAKPTNVRGHNSLFSFLLQAIDPFIIDFEQFGMGTMGGDSATISSETIEPGDYPVEDLWAAIAEALANLATYLNEEIIWLPKEVKPAAPAIRRTEKPFTELTDNELKALAEGAVRVTRELAKAQGNKDYLAADVLAQVRQSQGYTRLSGMNLEKLLMYIGMADPLKDRIEKVGKRYLFGRHIFKTKHDTYDYPKALDEIGHMTAYLASLPPPTFKQKDDMGFSFTTNRPLRAYLEAREMQVPLDAEHHLSAARLLIIHGNTQLEMSKLLNAVKAIERQVESEKGYDIDRVDKKTPKPRAKDYQLHKEIIGHRMSLEAEKGTKNFLEKLKDGSLMLGSKAMSPLRGQVNQTHFASPENHFTWIFRPEKDPNIFYLQFQRITPQGHKDLDKTNRQGRRILGMMREAGISVGYTTIQKEVWGVFPVWEAENVSYWMTHGHAATIYAEPPKTEREKAQREDKEKAKKADQGAVNRPYAGEILKNLGNMWKDMRVHLKQEGKPVIEPNGPQGLFYSYEEQANGAVLVGFYFATSQMQWAKTARKEGLPNGLINLRKKFPTEIDEGIPDINNGLWEPYLLPPDNPLWKPKVLGQAKEYFKFQGIVLPSTHFDKGEKKRYPYFLAPAPEYPDTIIPTKTKAGNFLKDNFSNIQARFKDEAQIRKLGLGNVKFTGRDLDDATKKLRATEEQNRDRAEGLTAVQKRWINKLYRQLKYMLADEVRQTLNMEALRGDDTLERKIKDSITGLLFRDKIKIIKPEEWEEERAGAEAKLPQRTVDLGDTRGLFKLLWVQKKTKTGLKFEPVLQIALEGSQSGAFVGNSLNTMYTQDPTFAALTMNQKPGPTSTTEKFERPGDPGSNIPGRRENILWVNIRMKKLPELGRRFDKNPYLFDLGLALRMIFLSDPQFRECEEMEQLATVSSGKIEDIENPELQEKVVAYFTNYPYSQFILEKGFDIYDYQKIGIYFANLSNWRCIIGDDMGLGKTIQAMGSLVKAVQDGKIQKLPGRKMCLVIAPASILKSWENEFQDWAPQFNAKMLLSSYTKKPELMTQFFDAQKPQSAACQVHIMSYDSLNIILPLLLTNQYQMVVFDEMHRIKNNRAQRTRAALILTDNIKFILGLSGTLMENVVNELYVPLHMMDPTRYPSFTTFAKKYGGVQQETGGFTFEDAAGKERLRLELRCYMIRRFKSKVLGKILPPKYRVPTAVTLGQDAAAAYAEVKAKLTTDALTRLNLRRCQLAVDLFLRDPGVSITQAIWQANNSIDDLSPDTLERLEKGRGMIAQGILLRTVGELKTSLAAQWIENYFKRGEILSTKLLQMAEAGIEPQDVAQEAQWKNIPVTIKVFPSKFVEIPDPEKSSRKIQKWMPDSAGEFPPLVIFIKHQKVMNSVRKTLEGLGFDLNKPGGYTFVDGSVPAAERGKRVDDFNKKGLYKVFLGSQAIREGVTLTRSHRMLFIELWYVPARIDQAEDRIWRIGQTTAPYIHYLIATGTVDEDVYGIIARKRALVTELLGSEDITAIEEANIRLGEGKVASSIAEEIKANLLAALQAGIENPEMTQADPACMAEMLGVPISMVEHKTNDPTNQNLRTFLKTREITVVTPRAAGRIWKNNLMTEIITQLFQDLTLHTEKQVAQAGSEEEQHLHETERPLYLIAPGFEDGVLNMTRVTVETAQKLLADLATRSAQTGTLLAPEMAKLFALVQTLESKSKPALAIYKPSGAQKTWFGYLSELANPTDYNRFAKAWNKLNDRTPGGIAANQLSKVPLLQLEDGKNVALPTGTDFNKNDGFAIDQWAAKLNIRTGNVTKAQTVERIKRKLLRTVRYDAQAIAQKLGGGREFQSYSHQIPLTVLNKGKLSSSIKKTEDAIKEVTGKSVTIPSEANLNPMDIIHLAGLSTEEFTKWLSGGYGQGADIAMVQKFLQQVAHKIREDYKMLMGKKAGGEITAFKNRRNSSEKLPTRWSEYSGNVGTNRHITARFEGTIDPQNVWPLLSIPGQMGEEKLFNRMMEKSPGSRRYTPAQWEALKEDIRRQGILHPILIILEWGEGGPGKSGKKSTRIQDLAPDWQDYDGPVDVTKDIVANIYEGNHRVRLAHQLGVPLPVEIQFRGHTEKFLRSLWPTQRFQAHSPLGLIQKMLADSNVGEYRDRKFLIRPDIKVDPHARRKNQGFAHPTPGGLLSRFK